MYNEHQLIFVSQNSSRFEALYHKIPAILRLKITKFQRFLEEKSHFSDICGKKTHE